MIAVDTNMTGVRRWHFTGPMVHDARVAAVCLLHGVRELWTTDRTSGAFAA